MECSLGLYHYIRIETIHQPQSETTYYVDGKEVRGCVYGAIRKRGFLLYTQNDHRENLTVERACVLTPRSTIPLGGAIIATLGFTLTSYIAG